MCIFWDLLTMIYGFIAIIHMLMVTNQLNAIVKDTSKTTRDTI